jgi:hypothetical protein
VQLGIFGKSEMILFFKGSNLLLNVGESGFNVI